YDERYVKAHTDLPLLVRMDTGKLLRASDVFPDYRLAELRNNIVVLKEGEKGTGVAEQPGPVVDAAKRAEWGDHVMWDAEAGEPRAVDRDQVSGRFATAGFDPMLETPSSGVTVKLVDAT